MPPWLAITLGICGVSVTLMTVLVKLGAWSGADAARLVTLEGEVKTLREWRHTAGNLQMNMAALDVMGQRMTRVENKVFNGGPK